MKKALLLIFALTGTGKLMAQTDLKLSQINPLPQFDIKTDTATLNMPMLKNITPFGQTNALKNLYDFDKLPKGTIARVPLNDKDQYNMPIAVLSGYSNMPVKKIGGFYTMPVVGKDVNKKKRITAVTP